MRRKKEQKPSRRGVMKNNFWLLSRIWRYTPGYIVWMVIEGVVWGINHTVGILYIEKLFHALGERVSFFKAAAVVLSYAVYLLVFWLFHHWYWTIYNPKVREKLHIALHSDLFSQAVRLDLARYDDPTFYNDFIWAIEESYSHATGLMEDTGKLINRVVASVTLTGVLFSVDATMAVVIFALSALRIGLTFGNNRVNLTFRDRMNPLNRKDGYIDRVFKLPDYAKELRVTRVSENLLAEYDANVEKKKALISGFGWRFCWLSFANRAIMVLGDTGLFILILYKVMVTGEVGLGGLAVAVNALWKMSWLLSDLIDRLMKYHEHGIFIEKIRRFVGYRPAIQGGGRAAGAFQSLTLRGVRFAYPGADEDAPCALDGVDMEIRRGEKIAIVGYNGAGKTTLTKLMMRLYDPTQGDILYNGHPLKEYTVESLRERAAAVFQDYRLFACSLAENVVGGAYATSERERVLTALTRSTFAEKLLALPHGLDTHLTREFREDGTQLSGGEQQKVAIARAFYKDADLIVLDEPSSALDPDAEYELNRAIAAYADQKTVVFISHRLSTTRHADRIYMFEKGRIVESGTHDELMRANGKYAYMFNLQAEKYRCT